MCTIRLKNYEIFEDNRGSLPVVKCLIMRYSCEVPTKPNETTVTAPLGRWNEDVRVGGQPKMGM